MGCGLGCPGERKRHTGYGTDVDDEVHVCLDEGTNDEGTEVELDPEELRDAREESVSHLR